VLLLALLSPSCSARKRGRRCRRKSDTCSNGGN
jgi:hypothetical protein